MGKVLFIYTLPISVEMDNPYPTKIQWVWIWTKAVDTQWQFEAQPALRHRRPTCALGLHVSDCGCHFTRFDGSLEAKIARTGEVKTANQSVRSQKNNQLVAGASLLPATPRLYKPSSFSSISLTNRFWWDSSFVELPRDQINSRDDCRGIQFYRHWNWVFAVTSTGLRL